MKRRNTVVAAAVAVPLIAASTLAQAQGEKSWGAAASSERPNVMSAAPAAAQSLPFAGTWFLGACESPTGRLRLRGDRFTFYHYEEKTAFAADISNAAATGGTWTLKTSKGDFTATPGSDGRLTIGPAKDKPDTFARCPSAGRVEEVFFFNDVDRVDDMVAGAPAACENKPVAACVDHVWTYIDVNRDGNVSTAELSRAMRHFTKWAIFEDASTEMVDAMAAGQGANLAFGALIASAVIHSYDYDGSGQVSKAEFMTDFASEPGKEARILVDAKTQFGEMLRKLETAAPMAAQVFGGMGGGTPETDAGTTEDEPPPAKKRR